MDQPVPFYLLQPGGRSSTDASFLGAGFMKRFFTRTSKPAPVPRKSRSPRPSRDGWVSPTRQCFIGGPWLSRRRCLSMDVNIEDAHSLTPISEPSSRSQPVLRGRRPATSSLQSCIQVLACGCNSQKSPRSPSPLQGQSFDGGTSMLPTSSSVGGRREVVGQSSRASRRTFSREAPPQARGAQPSSSRFDFSAAAEEERPDFSTPTAETPQAPASSRSRIRGGSLPSTRNAKRSVSGGMLPRFKTQLRLGLASALFAAARRNRSRSGSGRKTEAASKARLRSTSTEDPREQSQGKELSRGSSSSSRCQGTPILPEPLLLELERCRMLLEDRRLCEGRAAPCSPEAAPSTKRANLLSPPRCNSLPPVPQFAAPLPEELPSPDVLRLRGHCSPAYSQATSSRQQLQVPPLLGMPGGSLPPCFSFGAPTLLPSGTAHRRPSSASSALSDGRLARAISAAEVALQACNSGVLLTPSTRSSLLDLTWCGELSSPNLQASPAQRLPGRRNELPHKRVQEAQILFAEMLAPFGSCSSFLDTSPQARPSQSRGSAEQRPSSAVALREQDQERATRRYGSAPPQGWDLEDSGFPGSRRSWGLAATQPEAAVLRPLNGTLPWFPAADKKPKNQSVQKCDPPTSISNMHVPDSNSGNASSSGRDTRAHSADKESEEKSPRAASAESTESPEDEAAEPWPGQAEAAMEEAAALAANLEFCQILAAALAEPESPLSVRDTAPLKD